MRTENAVAGVELEETRERDGASTLDGVLYLTSFRGDVEDNASMHTFTCLSISYPQKVREIVSG